MLDWLWEARGKFADVPVFQFLAGPGGFAEEGKAGVYGGVVAEAVDPDVAVHFVPAEVIDHLGENGFEGDAVEWVVGGHGSGYWAAGIVFGLGG